MEILLLIVYNVWMKQYYGLEHIPRYIATHRGKCVGTASGQISHLLYYVGLFFV